jgi:hypothetical protein
LSSRQGALHAQGLTAATVTCWLALFLLLNAFAVNALLWLASPTSHDTTVLHHTWDVLHGRSLDDSWGVMMSAIDYLKSPGADPVYSELFYKRGQRFQYPPSSLFMLEGMLRLVGVDFVRTNKHAIYDSLTLNDALGWMFIALSAAVTSLFLERSLRQIGLKNDTRLLSWIRAACVLGLTLTFYPIVKAYTLGQIQVWINGLFALALLCWAYGRPAIAGVLLGVISLIKPHFGLFLIWGALRRAWSFTAAFAITVGIGVIASLIVYGFANHLDYVRVLREISQSGEVYYPNQSINGLLNRMMSLVDPQSYNSLSFSGTPPYNLWVHTGTLAATAVFLAAALFWRSAGDTPQHRVLDFCMMGLGLMLASPIAWEHHYGITLPMFAIVLATCDRRRLAWLALSYLLIGTYIHVTDLLSSTPWNVVQSYLLIGAFVLFALIRRALSDREAGLPRHSMIESSIAACGR